MMEQTQPCVDEGDAVLITSLNHAFVIRRTSWRCDVINAGLLRSIDVVPEREEGVGRNRDFVQLRNPIAFFDVCQLLWRIFKGILINICGHVDSEHSGHENVDDVRLFGTLHSFLEHHLLDSWMLTKPPVVDLVAG